MRHWKGLKNDEIYALWITYVNTCCNGNVLGLNNYVKDKCVRLTYAEVHTLVDELLDRLDIKEKSD